MTSLRKFRRTKVANPASAVEKTCLMTSEDVKSSMSSCTGSFSPDSLIGLAPVYKVDASTSTSTLNIVSPASSLKGSIVAVCPQTPETLVHNITNTSTDGTTSIGSVDSLDERFRGTNYKTYNKENECLQKSKEDSDSRPPLPVRRTKFDKNRAIQHGSVCYNPQSIDSTGRKESGNTERTSAKGKRCVSANNSKKVTEELIVKGKNTWAGIPNTEKLSNSGNDKLPKREQFKASDQNSNKQIPKNKVIESNLPNCELKSKIPIRCFRNSNFAAANINYCYKSDDLSLNSGDHNIVPQKSFVTDIEIFMPQLTISKNNVVYKSSKAPKVTRREICPDKVYSQPIQEREKNSPRDLNFLMKFPAVQVAVTKVNKSTKDTIKELKEKVNILSPKANRKIQETIKKTAVPESARAWQCKQLTMERGKAVEASKASQVLEPSSRKDTVQYTRKVQAPSVDMPSQRLGNLKTAARRLDLSMPPACRSPKGYKIITQCRPFPENKRTEKQIIKLPKMGLLDNTLLSSTLKKKNDRKIDECAFEGRCSYHFDLEELSIPPFHRKAWSMNEWSNTQKKARKKTYKELYLEQRAIKMSESIKQKSEKLAKKIEDKLSYQQIEFKQTDPPNTNVNHITVLTSKELTLYEGLNAKPRGEKSNAAAARRKLGNKNYLLYGKPSSQNKLKELLSQKSKKTGESLLDRKVPAMHTDRSKWSPPSKIRFRR